MMIKHSGRCGFPSDPTVDYVYTFSWIIDITCAILSMNAHFDQKKDKSIYWVNSNARHIAFYCEFSNAVLGHTIRMLACMNEKTQSYIFT